MQCIMKHFNSFDVYVCKCVCVGTKLVSKAAFYDVSYFVRCWASLFISLSPSKIFTSHATDPLQIHLYIQNREIYLNRYFLLQLRVFCFASLGLAWFCLMAQSRWNDKNWFVMVRKVKFILCLFECSINFG